MYVALMMVLMIEIASLFGCASGLGSPMTALSLVSVGVCLPDTFVSMKAAINEKYADASLLSPIFAVFTTVLFGMGIPWTISSLYSQHYSLRFNYYSGAVKIQAIAFVPITTLWFVVLVLRSKVRGGGTLGGKTSSKVATGLAMIVLYLLFLIVAGMRLDQA